jgi:melibiose permease
MMLFPLFRKHFPKKKLFEVAALLEISGYVLILMFAFTGITRITPQNQYGWIICFVPGLLIFMGSGLLNVLLTIFLSDSIDYGEYLTGRRDESIICSMQTFVVKLASGISAFLAGLAIKLVGLNVTNGATVADQSVESLIGLRVVMTVVPIAGLICAIVLFHKKYKLDETTLQDIMQKLKEKR